MKILQVHNLYQRSGGEDVVVAAERELLKAHGHQVFCYSVSNHAIKGVGEKLSIAWNSSYSQSSRKRFAAELGAVKPDLVHVHNFFPLLTPSIYDACRDAGVQVVQTLHNYRLICPGAFLERDGEVCEKCLDGSFYRAAWYGCYRGSRIASLVVARMVSMHHRLGTWHSKINRFIALTEFAKSRFVKAGFPEERIAVKPNFERESALFESFSSRSGALFVGRLSQEKGILTLLTAWRHLDTPIRIIGDGPMVDEVRDSGLFNVTYEGHRTRQEVMTAMQRASFLVLPSECYEGFPMVLVEAFAYGLPVIAARIGSLAEIVRDGETGITFEAGNPEDLAAKIRWAVAHPDAMEKFGETALLQSREKYSPEVNYRRLMEIYHEAIAEIPGKCHGAWPT